MSKKVLVIDDSASIISIVKAVLREGGFNAQSASNGEMGIQLAGEEHPDLIILDRHLPGMDGNEVLTRFKKDRFLSHIPVVMLTSENKLEEIKASMALGAAAYIIKPFQPKDFLVKINAVLAKKGDSSGTWQVG